MGWVKWNRRLAIVLPTNRTTYQKNNCLNIWGLRVNCTPHSYWIGWLNSTSVEYAEKKDSFASSLFTFTAVLTVSLRLTVYSLRSPTIAHSPTVYPNIPENVSELCAEVCATEVCATEVCLREVCAIEVCTTKVCTREVCTTEICAMEKWTALNYTKTSKPLGGGALQP